MRIDKVKYTQEFKIGFTSQWIGVEVSLDEGDGAKAALEMAKGVVTDFYNENKPKEEEVIDRVDERLKMLADNCKTLEQLADIKSQFQKEKMAIYMTRLKEITNNKKEN